MPPPPTTIADLEAALVTGQPISVLDLATTLLGWCRGFAQELTEMRGFAAACEVHARAYRDGLGVIGATIRGERVYASAQVALKDLVRRVLPEQAERRSIAAFIRGLALALDEKCGELFLRCLRDEIDARPDGSVLRRADEAVPIAAVRLNEIRRDLCTNPDDLQEPTDGLRHLRLLPSGLVFRVRLLIEPHDQVHLEGSSLLGALLPIDTVGDMEQEEYDRHGQRLFANVRPRDDDEVRNRVLDLVQAGEDRGLRVAVLPELAVVPDALSNIHQWVASSDRKLRVVLAGSRHERIEVADEGTAPWKNRTTLFIGKRFRVDHDKISPFRIKPEKHDQDRREKFEDISLHPLEVTIVFSCGWSVMPLICKDVLHDDILSTLVAARVRMTLVAACSPETNVFEDATTRIAAFAQGWVIVANTPGQDRAAARAIFGQPSRGARMFQVGKNTRETRGVAEVRLDGSGDPVLHST